MCLLVSFLIMQSVNSGTVGFSYKGRGLRAPFACCHVVCINCPTNCLHFPSCCVQQKLDGVCFFTKASAKIYFQTVDEKPQFTDEELQEYIRQYHAQPGVVPVCISM